MHRCTRTPAHLFTPRRQHHNTVLGLRARLGTRGSILCYSQRWDGRLLQPEIARKSFGAQTRSRGDVRGSKSMTNPHHTQKIDSEPPGMKMFMQKRDSPDARFMMSE